MGGRVRDVAWCLLVCWAPAASCALSVGAVRGWWQGRAFGAFCRAWCRVHCGTPVVVGRGAGWRGRLGCDACAGGRVGVAALGCVARARRQTMAGVDRSSTAAASRTIPFLMGCAKAWYKHQSIYRFTNADIGFVLFFKARTSPCFGVGKWRKRTQNRPKYVDVW